MNKKDKLRPWLPKNGLDKIPYCSFGVMYSHQSYGWSNIVPNFVISSCTITMFLHCVGSVFISSSCPQCFLVILCLFCYISIALKLSLFSCLSLAMGPVRFRFGSVSMPWNQTKPNQTLYIKPKPNQTVYENSKFKPNHLKKKVN